MVRGLFRGRRKSDDDDEQSLFVEGEESHAWWAERENVTTAPNPKKRGAAAREAEAKKRPPSTESGFKQYFTNESLYSTEPEPEPEPELEPNLRPWPEKQALEVLGVIGEPTWRTITKAYREKAKEFHPDRRGGDDTEMVKINQAYSLLRRTYT